MSAKGARKALLRFKLPYWTQWGQNVVIKGSWDGASKRGQPLSCRHEGGSLVWEAQVSVPVKGDHVMYKYAITNDAGEFEMEEAGMRKVAIPKDLQDGGVIDLQDEWQVRFCEEQGEGAVYLGVPGVHGATYDWPN